MPVRFFADDTVAWVPPAAVTDFRANMAKNSKLSRSKKFQDALKEAQDYHSQELVSQQMGRDVAGSQDDDAATQPEGQTTHQHQAVSSIITADSTNGRNSASDLKAG